MAKLSQLRTDPTKEEEGIWVPYALDIEFKIARNTKPAFRAAVDKIMKPHQKRVRKNRMKNEEIMELIKPAVAEHILIDWKNVQDDEENPIPCTLEEKNRVFNDPEYKDIYSFITEQSTDWEEYLAELTEDAAGNS